MSNLEQITQQSFNQKTSFFQRIRNSLTSKLAILISAGTFALAGCGDENENPASSPHDDWPQITRIYQGGIPISSGKTNSEGEIRFEEGSRGVDIHVVNENNQPVNNAQVTYFDGNDFECFQVNRNNYAPQLECFAHNSSHTLSLTTSPLQISHHDSYGNERSKSAAINCADWAESNWEYLGCRDETQLEAMMDGGSYIIKLLSKIFTFGFSDPYVDAAYDHLKGELDENDAGHIYLFNPSKHGLYGTSTIWTIDFKTKEIENCNDNLDNDCDGKIDSEDSDCTCANECSYSGQKECFSSGWKECGDFDSDLCLEWSSLHSCGSDEHCEDGLCQPENGSYCDPCNSDYDCQEGMECRWWVDTNITWCTDDLQCNDNSDCGGGYSCHSDNICAPAIYLECHYSDVWLKDSCNNWLYEHDICTSDETCQDGQCKSQSLNCTNDNDCNLDHICKKSTSECLEEPSSLCSGSNCIDVLIHIFDSGAAADDSFGLEIVGSFYGETEPGGGKTWTIPMVANQTYEMIVYGIGVPDGVGTYTVELTNANAINGPPLSGNNLDAGMAFTWHIKPEETLVCSEGSYECNGNALKICNNNSWDIYTCDFICVEIGGYSDGADYCGYDPNFGHDACSCNKTACNQESYQCEGMNMTYCDLENGFLKTFPCDNLCQDGGYEGASSCSNSSSYGHDVCFCY